MSVLTADGLARSAADPAPPAELAGFANRELLKAMWLAERGHWDAAHGIAQDDDSEDGAWVHAYLHRVEGDLGNAGYWYGRAARPRCTEELAAEWHQIVAALLEQGAAGDDLPHDAGAENAHGARADRDDS